MQNAVLGGSRFEGILFGRISLLFLRLRTASPGSSFFFQPSPYLLIVKRIAAPAAENSPVLLCVPACKTFLREVKE